MPNPWWYTLHHIKNILIDQHIAILYGYTHLYPYCLHMIPSIIHPSNSFQCIFNVMIGVIIVHLIVIQSYWQYVIFIIFNRFFAICKQNGIFMQKCNVNVWVTESSYLDQSSKWFQRIIILCHTIVSFLIGPCPGIKYIGRRFH